MSNDARLPAKTEPSPLSTADYETIEQAVMETARGRWFLAEYARRNRVADTLAVLEAVGRLENAVAAPRTGGPEIDRIRMDIREMAGAIARTKAEIASIKPEGAEGGRFEEASIELDAIVKATATATGDILSAAETIQEIAWTLREMGAEGEVCDLIDTKATDIYTACSFQDITGQRVAKVVETLKHIESRVSRFAEAINAADADGYITDEEKRREERKIKNILHGPALAGEGVDQDDVDAMFDKPAQPRTAQDDIDALFK